MYVFNRIFSSTIKCMFFLFFINVGGSQASEIKIHKTNDTTISIQKIDFHKYFTLPLSINGYSVNCRGNMLTIWGKPKEINLDLPQENIVVIFNLRTNKIISKNKVMHGVFGAKYMKDSESVYLETDSENIINLRNGKTRTADPNNEAPDHYVFESCIKTKSSYYDKFQD